MNRCCCRRRLLLLLVSFSALSLLCQSNPTLKVLSSVQSPIGDAGTHSFYASMSTASTRAYATFYKLEPGPTTPWCRATGLAVFDTTDALAPRFVAKHFSQDYSADSCNYDCKWTDNVLHASGKYLYVAAGEAGVLALDVTDPTQAVLAGALKAETVAVVLALDGDVLWVAEHSAFRSVDVSNPAAPRAIAEVQLDASWPEAMVIFGGYAYIASNTVSTYVVDVRDPASPQLVGHIKLDKDETHWMGVVNGTTLVLSDNFYSGALWYCDIATDPVDPECHDYRWPNVNTDLEWLLMLPGTNYFVPSNRGLSVSAHIRVFDMGLEHQDDEAVYNLNLARDDSFVIGGEPFLYGPNQDPAFWALTDDVLELVRWGSD
eukprot:TRINITY_DN39_c1_g1_i1.p2 TRINITY_DN39_c1_g1~~TRINITY_DN39_c1_g1_i1.p2  ORF type:complete len:375 (+),score=133.91 TRINITY_DN39_c1_g1_i1:148-1272(+)